MPQLKFRTNRHNPALFLLLSLCGLTLLSGTILASSATSADVVDDVTINVPVACNMTGELDTPHTATINPGQNQTDIGTTNFTVFCNDNSGYSIYAIGYSNEEYGNNKLLATINNQLTPAYDIITGTATSGATSNWSMKLTSVTGTYAPTIESDTNGSFASYHVVPTEYTKVATFASNTDFTIGSSLQSTYQAYITSTQPAGTYAGKIKYTMVHPDSAEPFMPHEIACESEKICYHTNVAPTETEGFMEGQSLVNHNIDWSSCANTNYSNVCLDRNYRSIDISTLPKLDHYSISLMPSDYSRPDYGFAGWNTAHDYSGTNYGPAETITIENNVAENGLSLYAIWVPVARDANNNELTFQTVNFKTVTLKDGSTLNDKPNGYVTALRDIRDNDVYATAKLADGQYWMIENLRLDNTANITTSNTQSNNGQWGGAFVGLADPEPDSNFGKVIPNSLYDTSIITGNSRETRFPRYNNDNTIRAENAKAYSFGNSYSWAAAAADTTFYNTEGESNITATSICSSGWRLPISADYSTLSTATDDSAFSYYKYPNNFLNCTYASATIYYTSHTETNLNDVLSSGSLGRIYRQGSQYIHCIAQ